MTIQVGDPAPTFTGKIVRDGEVEAFDLADEIGEDTVVLAFFPFAFSGGCTKENCAIRDEHADLLALNARVFGVCVDSYFSLKAFAEANDLEHALVSDGRREGINAYDVAYDEFLGVSGVAKRSVFIIDADGTVQYAWVTDDAGVMPDLEEVKSVLNKLS